MSVMKTSLTIFPCVLGSAFLYIRVCPGLSFATKRIGPPCCTLFTFVTCYSLQFILSQNYLLPLISVLAENTLLKTAYHFLLLLVGFDTLTYQKDYDRSPILVGHHSSWTVTSLQALALIQMTPSHKPDTYFYWMVDLSVGAVPSRASWRDLRVKRST